MARKMFIPAPGVAFLIPDETGLHLHFILTYPLRRESSDEEEVLTVGITSTEIDPEFTLDRGDHPFVKHRSYINYPRARILSVKEIEGKLARGKYKLKETASEEIVKYVCEGLLESRRSLPKHREFYEQACRS